MRIKCSQMGLILYPIRDTIKRRVEAQRGTVKSSLLVSRNGATVPASSTLDVNRLDLFLSP